MYSKLDQMRDQFRERLANLRPYNESRVHVIEVKIEDNFDSKVPKSDRNLPKSILKNNSKSYTESPKSFDEIKRFSANSSVDQSLKGTTPANKSYDSYDFQKKPNLSNDFDNKSLNKGVSDRILTTKQLNEKILSEKTSNKLSSDGLECRHCRRSFASSERLLKHESVCLSNVEKSRQKFNSVEQRFKGLPKEYRNSYEKSLNSEPKERGKPWNWRQKHEYCMASIKAAKGEVGSGPTTSEIMAMIQKPCDYCKRRFNDDALKRHVPICARIYRKQVANNSSMKF